MGKLEQLAAAAGLPVDEFVVGTVNRLRSVYKAAAVFDTSPNTVFKWLRKNRYKPVITREWKREAATA